MLTNNKPLTAISQVDKLNREVWADSVREGETIQRVKPKFGEMSSPSKDTVDELEPNAPETLPPLDQLAQ